MIKDDFFSFIFLIVPNLRFPEFNDNWKKIAINTLLSFKNGVNADATKYGKGIKYISVGDILNNTFINYDKIKGLVDIDENTLQNYSVTYGDILFQRSSEVPEDIGQSNVYLDKNKTATFGGFVIRGKKIGEYNPLFFNYMLKCSSARKSIIRLGAGAQHYNIGQENLNTLSFYFPSSNEQVKIADLFSKIDEKIMTQIKIVNEYKSLINGLKDYILKNFSHEKDILLGDICTITTGKLDANAMVENGKYRFYTCAENYYFINEYAFDEEALLISGNGANVGYIHHYIGKFNSYQRTYVLTKFEINPLLVKLNLDVNLKKRIDEQKNIGNTPYIKLETINNMKIFVLDESKERSSLKLINLYESKLDKEKDILTKLTEQKQFLQDNLFI